MCRWFNVAESLDPRLRGDDDGVVPALPAACIPQHNVYAVKNLTLFPGKKNPAASRGKATGTPRASGERDLLEKAME